MVCSICKKTGHNARGCPNKRKKPKSTKALKKPLKTKGKYPNYFYENAPSWVARLNKAGLKVTPTGSGATAKSCANCQNLVTGKGIATGEPFCSKNSAAVRGQWICNKWKKGDVNKIKARPLGEDV